MTANDYRPIALLSQLSEILERLIFDQLTVFLQRHSVLDPLQCGFRKRHSTSTALLKLINDVCGGMDRRQETVLVLFDFSKAFDTVHHGLLLRKMSMMGLSQSTIDLVPLIPEQHKASGQFRRKHTEQLGQNFLRCSSRLHSGTFTLLALHK